MRLAHYADFYDIKHVLILGRCTSGRGGTLILDGAKRCLQAEFPELAAPHPRPAAGREKPPGGPVDCRRQPAGQF